MFLHLFEFAHGKDLCPSFWDLLPYIVELVLWYLLMMGNSNERDGNESLPIQCPTRTTPGKCLMTPLLLYVAETVEIATPESNAVPSRRRVKRSNQIVLKSKTGVSSGLV